MPRFALLFATLLAACGKTPVEPAAETLVVEEAPAVAEAPPEPAPPPPPPPPKEWDTGLTHSVRLLAGLDLPADSELYAITQDPAYQALKADIDEAWSTYEEKDLAQIRVWARDTLGGIPAGPVFYPFSGPDTLNAVSFLPQGTSYTMMGLEPVGSLPRLDAANPTQVMQAAQGIKQALVNILGMNFFHTKIMAVSIGSNSYNGIAGVMSWFLARTGHDVLDARLVALDPSGEVIPAAEAAPEAVTGVELKFRVTGETSDEAVKTAWYFPGDISDDGWSQRPGLAAFVGAQGEVITFLKAASYLMFRNGFDDIRNTILSRSRAVIEDASGVPYHYFADGDFDVKLYGAYTKPIPLFEVRCQPDLVKASAANTAGELPFSFGYTHWNGHMLYATREGDMKPVPIDANSNVGESTYCNAGRLIIDGR